MTDASRNERIISLIPIVYRCARRIRYRYPDLHEYDELVGDGMIGAIVAVDNFDPKFGTLETYGWIRITGEMFDAVRRWHGRTYRDESRADSFKARARHSSLDEPIAFRGSEIRSLTLADVLPDDENAVVDMLDAMVVQEAIPYVPGQDAELLRRYYWEHETLGAIGKSMGVTESRACQLLEIARRRMYRVLTADGTQEMR